MVPLKILLFAAAAWLVVGFFRKRKGGVSALTVLGVVSIVAGLGVFGMRASDRWNHETVHVSTRVHPHSFERGDFVKIDSPVPVVRFERGFSSDFDFDGPPKWMIISLGTLLVIAGSLLAGRDRTRPVAMKAFTVLGLGAIAYSVFAFFGSPPRIPHRHDRVVRVSQASDQHRAESSDEKKGKRPHRAKRPSSRSHRDRRKRDARRNPAAAGRRDSRGRRVGPNGRQSGSRAGRGAARPRRRLKPSRPKRHCSSSPS